MAILAITFQACRKEAFTEQLSASTTLKNPITSDAAKAWFQNQFGETKSISPNNITSSSDTLDGYYFDASYEITPLWSESKIAAFLQTNPILLVPVKPIPFLDAKGQNYTLVFFRDSLNQLDARLQVYEATPEYAKNNPKFSVDNFTGFFYQIHLTGKVDKVYGIEQGKFTLRIQLKPKEKSRIGKIQTRGLCDGCFYDDPTASNLKRAICWVCEQFDGGGGDNSVIIPVTPTDPVVYLSYGQNPWTDNSVDNTFGGGSSNGNNYQNTNNNINTNNLAGELGNEIFDMTDERATLLAIHRRLNMNIMETDFLKNNRQAALQMESYLLSHTTTEGTDNAHAHLTSLMNNAAYRLANQQAAYVATIIETLGKYTKAGFMAEEFAELYAENALFQQVDAFLKTKGFNNESRLNVKGFTFLLGVDDDFKALNQNRGGKTIKQLIDEYGYPNLKSATLMGLARKNGVTYIKDGKVEINFFRLGRIQEDAVIRSIQGVSKNTKAYQDPLGQRISTIPDIVTEGFTTRLENGIIKEIWSSAECSFLDSKFTSTGVIKDNITTTDQGEIRQQLSTMIDVLANMKGVAYNSIIMPNWKPADHGIAALTIVTIHDAEIDPILINQAASKNVRMHKRWLELDLETQQIKVSTNFQLTVNPATNKGGDVPTLRSDAVDFNWSVQ